MRLGSRTGGPEALHQLAHELSSQGEVVGAWYYQPEDFRVLAEARKAGKLRPGLVLKLPQRETRIPDYDRYQVEPLQEIHFSAETVFVVSETWTELAVYFQGFRTIFWWLSVDFAFRSLSQINLNFLRFPNFYHAYQSDYADSFLRALGFNNVVPLSDYSVISGVGEADQGLGSTKRNLVVFGANPRKIIFDLKVLSERMSSELACQTIIANGMTKEQVDQGLQVAKVYVELGNSPGKDRMPREALLKDCLVYALKCGAWRDYNLPEDYYLDLHELPLLISKVRDGLANYERHRLALQAARQKVIAEPSQFQRDVRNLRKRLEN